MNKTCICSQASYNHSHGFGSTIAITMISIGTLALSIATLNAMAAYSDSVNRDEWRIQADLYRKACSDSADLIRAKDVFVKGAVYISDFDCTLNF